MHCHTMSYMVLRLTPLTWLGRIAKGHMSQKGSGWPRVKHPAANENAWRPLLPPVDPCLVSQCSDPLPLPDIGTIRVFKLQTAEAATVATGLKFTQTGALKCSHRLTEIGTTHLHTCALAMHPLRAGKITETSVRSQPDPLHSDKTK